MERIQELISVLSDNEVLARSYTAKSNRLCKICGKPADSFRTSFCELEYRISAICQACQDYFYLAGDDTVEGS